MALWFSASAVVPSLVAEYRLSGFMQAALTSGVQAGFVARLPGQRVPRPRRTGSIRAASSPRRALLGAAANALLLVVDPGDRRSTPLLRFVTGIAMAGVYPVGMKLASTWAKGDMGLMVGILVGALTLGSASPHLFNALGGVDWRIPVAVSPRCRALAAALLIGFAGIGPNRRAGAARSIRAPCSTPGATCRCGSPTSATSATCGSSTRCGRGSACSCRRASR